MDFKSRDEPDSADPLSIRFGSDPHQDLVRSPPPSSPGFLPAPEGLIDLHQPAQPLPARTHHRPFQRMQQRPGRLVTAPSKKPAASPTRLPRSSAWSRTGWHGTRPSTAHGCPGRSLSPLPRPATDTLGRAKVLAPSPMSLDLCTADRRAPPTSAARTDTTGKHLLSRTAAPVPVTPGDSLPRKYTTGWGRLSNVNIPTSKMLRKFRSTSAILSPYSPPIRTAAENVR